jgi:hypothetical protein
MAESSEHEPVSYSHEDVHAKVLSFTRALLGRDVQVMGVDSPPAPEELPHQDIA